MGELLWSRAVSGRAHVVDGAIGFNGFAKALCGRTFHPERAYVGGEEGWSIITARGETPKCGYCVKRATETTPSALPTLKETRRG